jgi:hypothetical protein
MIRKTLFYTPAFAALTTALLGTAQTFAASFNLSMSEGASSARGVDQVANLFGTTGIFTTVSNVMLFAVGAISVIMIIIGGLRYVVSGGNTSNVAAAKNTILYAVVGIIISMLAYAIINFVIASFSPDGSNMGVGGTNV